MGTLIVDKIDLNDKETINNIISVLQKLVRKDCYSLRFKSPYYFEVPENNLPSEPGWYVIIDQKGRPIYVGKADDLNARLNTNQGTVDNFANKGRKSDDARNFIKKFNELGILDLKVSVIKERELCEEIGISFPLSSLDRANVEKLLNIFRSYFKYP